MLGSAVLTNIINFNWFLSMTTSAAISEFSARFSYLVFDRKHKSSKYRTLVRETEGEKVSNASYSSTIVSPSYPPPPIRTYLVNLAIISIALSGSRSYWSKTFPNKSRATAELSHDEAAGREAFSSIVTSSLSRKPI